MLIFFKWLRQPFCFLMDSSQKLIRSSEIPREQPNLKAMQATVHKLSCPQAF